MRRKRATCSFAALPTAASSQLTLKKSIEEGEEEEEGGEGGGEAAGGLRTGNICGKSSGSNKMLKLKSRLRVNAGGRERGHALMRTRILLEV